MRAFLDTNVILEFFLDREAGKTACQLFAKYRDIEDSCQFQAAKKAGCKVLIKTNKGTARRMSSDAFFPA
jgi:predicted nucleic acid-binding protein